MYVIGIAGGSGSGKSTFSRKLREMFADDVVVLQCDNYYLPRDDLSFEEREKINYDSPEAIDFDLLIRQIRTLAQGQSVFCPVYDFSRHTRSAEHLTVSPKSVLIVEGILLFAREDLRDLFDLKIYVDADADERILRRTRRDLLDRGRTIDSVINQYVTTVKPMHNRYVEPSKAYADIVINGGFNPTALELVANQIRMRKGER